MSAHHEVIAVAPKKIADPREPEDNVPAVPLQESHVDGFKEPDPYEAPAEAEPSTPLEPPTEPPVVMAPAADEPSPLDGRTVYREDEAGVILGVDLAANNDPTGGV